MRILVVHRAVVFADALAKHLTGVPGVTLVDTAYTSDQSLARLSRGEHDAMLMPRSSMEEFSRLQRSGRDEADHRSRRVIFAIEVTPAIVVECIAAGMDAVLSINQTPVDMVAQLVDVVAGRMHLSNHPFAAHVDGAVEEPSVFKTIAYHDAADIEIVRLVAAGLSDKEISHIVNYSGQTVRNRISRILQDSHIANRTQLATAFLRNDI